MTNKLVSMVYAHKTYCELLGIWISEQEYEKICTGWRAITEYIKMGATSDEVMKTYGGYIPIIRQGVLKSREQH